MKLAFILFNYFPYGGLQRDFLRIAEEALARNHQIDVHTMQWEGSQHPQIQTHLYPARGLRNHSQRLNFVKAIQPALNQKNYDVIVGFNKMPNLDVYYAADTCYQAKAKTQRSWFYRLTKRYRSTVMLEENVFALENKTKILLISELQQQEFEKYYQTPKERFYLLPPGIEKNRLAPDNRDILREDIRKKFSITNDTHLLLFVGSGFKTKGLDRAIIALANLPKEIKLKTKLFVVGKDNPKQFIKLAKQHNVLKQVIFFGGRNDIPQLLMSADLLIHPAYNENTGTVLLEALASGTPVLTTDVCGYAKYINEANAGVVVSSPFSQENFNNTLQQCLRSAELQNWGKKGINFAKNADIYNMPKYAMDVIEQC